MIDQIPVKFLSKWRRLLNLVADTFEVPVALIMRLNETNLEVLVASESPENPYRELTTGKLSSGFYCEAVLQSGDELQVVDALEDPDWDHNPDIALGLIHYLGMPLIWPDGRKFGTLCVLDSKARDHANGHKNLLRHVKEQIESEFRLIEFEQGLIDSNDHLGLLVEQRTEELREEMAERSRLERSLRQVQKMEALTVLAGGVAHDLNNILSGVVSYPDALMAQLDSNDPMRGALKTMRDSGLRAASVVDDLLTVAHPLARLREQVSVNEIVAEYLASPEGLTLQTENPRVEILTDLEDDLPFVESVSVSVNKCVMNLVINAIDALVAGGEVRIFSRSQKISAYDNGPVEAGSYVVLSVRDNGPGISAQAQQHIFEPYYTTKNLGRGGSGLGLTAVWNIVAEHGGQVLVNSSEAGTEFDLYFPASQLAPVEPVKKVSRPGNNESILVVDDEPSQRDVLRAMLKALGYQATTAASGEEALEQMRQQRYSLLILDMAMPPGLNGPETYEAALRIEPGQKAIISSGLLEPEEVRSATTLGISTFLRKPYKLADLADAVSSNLPNGVASETEAGASTASIPH